MAQLSRPYQIVLGVVLVFGLVWAVALHGRAGNPSEPAPSTPPTSPPVPSAAAGAKPTAPTPVYHGKAPGVEGLTRDVAKAHGAVAISQQNAQKLQGKSGEASNESPSSPAASSSPATHASAGSATAAHKSAQHVRVNGHVHLSAAATKAHEGQPAEQLAVERELAHGKTVMLVFWNPKSTVDVEVHAQAKVLASRSKGKLELHAARAGQIGTFGKITEVARVYQTPTILIVNKQGVVSTLTGLTDVFALEQAVREARNANA